MATVLGAAAAFLLITVIGAAPAHAQAYQFWGYYSWSDADGWAIASTGPDEVVPKDGAVDGWRFAISVEDPRPPRADGDFEQLCGDTAAEDGKKRVGVVIDYGLVEEAPEGQEAPQPIGECAVVAPDASSGQVLAAVATVRTEGGLYCAIDEFPSSGCGDEVSDVPDISLPEEKVELTTAGEDAGSGNLPIWGIAVGALLLVVIVGGVLGRRLRGGSADSEASG